MTNFAHVLPNFGFVTRQFNVTEDKIGRGIDTKKLKKSYILNGDVLKYNMHVNVGKSKKRMHLVI